jgi:hypothetical protein
MVVKKCAECGVAVPPDATICPQCGASLKPGALPIGRALSAGALVLICVWAITLLFFARPKDPRGAASTVSGFRTAVNARVQHNVQDLYVTNLESTDWENISFYINDIILGYRYELALLQAGREAKISYLWFLGKDGTRYNPFSVKPETLFIHAEGRDPLVKQN